MNKQTNIVMLWKRTNQITTKRPTKPKIERSTDQLTEQTNYRPTVKTNERTDRTDKRRTDRAIVPTDHTNDGADGMNNGRIFQTNGGKNRQYKRDYLAYQDLWGLLSLQRHRWTFSQLFSCRLLCIDQDATWRPVCDMILRFLSSMPFWNHTEQKRFTRCGNCFYY